jgi:phosphoglucomutase
LNGNQIGALLLDYLLGQKEKKGQLPRNGAVVKSLVTSDLGKAIADAYGVKTFNTLTGFKYIAEKIKDFEQDGSYEFLFGYEESYGYLIGSFVRDKDAVQAAVLCAEMAAFYKQNNQTLFDVLEGLYQTHGYYQETLHSYQFEGKAGQEMMDAILSKLRKTDIAEIAGTPIAVRKDYLNGVDDLPPANVLRWELQDGSWIVIRPSGTEPKMKVYYSVNDRSKEKASRKLTQYVHAFQQLIDSLK